MKAPGLVGFHAVQLDGLNTMKNLIQPGGALACLSAGEVCFAANIALHEDGGQQQQGGTDQGSQGPAHVD